MAFLCVQLASTANAQLVNPADKQRVPATAQAVTSTVVTGQRTHADRNEFEEELLLGPSLQYRPSVRMHMDVATLVGIGADSPDAQAFVIVGYEF